MLLEILCKYKRVFMEIREKTIEEIKKLDSNSLMTLYEIVLSMKGHESNGDKKSQSSAYLNVRESLKKVKVSLSENILLGREDRL